jgi:tetratricopeptide (TPR) repeat protein
VIAVLLALPTWARAEEAVDPAREALFGAAQGAFDTGRNGEAYELAKELVARYPEDAQARYYAAYAAGMMYESSEVNEHIQAGLAIAPEYVDLLALRAGMRMMQGDNKGANQDITRALELDPESVFALDLRDQLELIARARNRLDGMDPHLDPGSPAAFVDRVCESFARGASAAELADFFDPELIENVPAAEHNHFTLSMALKEALEAIHEDRDRARALGWVVQADTTQDGDRYRVGVLVPMTMTITEKERRMFEVMHADPAGRELIDPYTRALLDGVDDAERPALLARMVGTTSQNLVLIEFELRALATGGYRVTDVMREGASLRDNIPTLARFAGELAPELARKPVDVPYLAGKLVGTLLFLGLAVWAVIWLRRR